MSAVYRRTQATEREPIQLAVRRRQRVVGQQGWADINRRNMGRGRRAIRLTVDIVLAVAAVLAIVACLWFMQP